MKLKEAKIGKRVKFVLKILKHRASTDKIGNAKYVTLCGKIIQVIPPSNVLIEAEMCLIRGKQGKIKHVNGTHNRNIKDVEVIPKFVTKIENLIRESYRVAGIEYTKEVI